MKLDIQLFAEPYIEFEDLPSTDTPIDATNLNNMQISIAEDIEEASSSGGGIISLKSITTAPSTFTEGDKYYNSNDDLIYTATSSSAWDNGETPSGTNLYLNEDDNMLYRYYDNSMNIEGGGETLPVGTEVDYDGSSIPTGWQQIDEKSKILWTNSSPTSNVASGTTATLSSDDYDYLIWLYCYNTNSANTNIQKSSVCLKGKSVMMNVIGYSTGGLMRRVADYTNDTTYTFRDAYNASNVDNSYCIPLYAIGCKF